MKDSFYCLACNADCFDWTIPLDLKKHFFMGLPENGFVHYKTYWVKDRSTLEDFVLPLNWIFT